MQTTCQQLLWPHYHRGTTGHQGKCSDAGTYENHLALSLGRKGDDWMFPAKCCDEMLHCASSVWAGIVMKHHNAPTKHATSLVLERMTQFLKCVTIDTLVDCWALRQEFQSRTPFMSQNTVHMIFRIESVCLNFFCWRWSVRPFDGMLLRFRGYMWCSLYRVRKVNALACP
jgi:hypothetical protein